MSPMEIRLGDIAHMRKKHPCGSFAWRITRVGADIGIRCTKCNRRVVLPREKFERCVVRLESGGEVVDRP